MPEETNRYERMSKKKQKLYENADKDKFSKKRHAYLKNKKKQKLYDEDDE